MKLDLIAKYQDAAKLRFTSPVEAWRAVFPSNLRLQEFRSEVGNLSWPGSYGSSPWEDAFSLAYELGNGISESSARFYAKELTRRFPQVRAEMAAHLALFVSYGGILPADLAAAYQVAETINLPTP